VTTVDVPLHLRKSEVFKPIISPNQSAIDEHPMAGVCRHLLDQRRCARLSISGCIDSSDCAILISFYPIFPVPKEFSGDVNLDVSHSRLLGIQSGAPDVMVLPSKLKEFTQVSPHIKRRKECILTTSHRWLKGRLSSILRLQASSTQGGCSQR